MSGLVSTMEDIREPVIPWYLSFSAWADMLDWLSSISARPVCSHEGCSDFFTPQTEQPVEEDSMRSGDIRALCPELYGFYITFDGVPGNRSDSEAPVEHQKAKKKEDDTP